MRVLAPGLILVLAALAGAADVPVGGHQLSLRANATQPTWRGMSLVVLDPALAPPFADPRSGAALVVSSGIGPGLCRAEIALDPAGWSPIGGDGAQHGWRYRVAAPGTQGVRRVTLRLGRLSVGARGGGWPCDLSAPAQPLPVSVAVRTAGTRYCAAFGGVTRNVAGRLLARDAAPPAACPKGDVTVADLNVLHGFLCPPATAGCRRLDRLDLLFQWIAARGCPDVVTLQEVWETSAPDIMARMATACPFAYQAVYVHTFGVDDEMILSRFPILDSGLVMLFVDFRHVTFARIDHPIGPLDVFATHLASGSDGAQDPCTAPDCPAECLAAGAATVRDCQAVQLANLVDARHDVPTPAIVAGDFNESPGSFAYQQLAARGWVDSYLAAGNPECDPGTSVGCTSGRQDRRLTDLESPVSNEIERIDYIFVVPPRPGSVCTATLDPASDADGDGTATRLFADQPNPFAPGCGPAPAAICWPSDHEGTELDLECG